MVCFILKDLFLLVFHIKIDPKSCILCNQNVSDPFSLFWASGHYSNLCPLPPYPSTIVPGS